MKKVEVSPTDVLSGQEGERRHGVYGMNNDVIPWTVPPEGAGWRECDALLSSRCPQDTQVEVSSRQLEMQVCPS